LDSVWIFIIVGIIVVGFGGAVNAIMSQNLQKKFISLGNMMGKTDRDIIAVVGKPDSIINVGGVGLVYLWISDNYQVSLSFQDGKCTGIVQETIKP